MNGASNFSSDQQTSQMSEEEIRPVDEDVDVGAVKVKEWFQNYK